MPPPSGADARASGAPSPVARRALLAALPLLLAAYYAYAFHPFEFRRAPQANGAVRVSPDTLSLPTPGIAVMEDPTGIGPGQRLDVAFRATPAASNADGARRTLVRVSGFPSRPQFALEQRGTALVVRLGTQRFPWQREAARIPSAFASDGPVDVSASLTADALRVAVAGLPPVQRPLTAAERRAAPPGPQVLIGNIENSSQPWLGRIGGVRMAIDGVDLEVVRRAVVPTHVPTVEHAPRLVPLRHLRPFDALQNFVGFLPLGVWIAFAFGPGRRRVLAWALAGGCALGLSIEIVQWWLPSRFVSVDDVWLNGAGSAVGAWLVGRWGDQHSVPRTADQGTSAQPAVRPAGRE